MRLVLDTNVLLSRLLFPQSVPGRLVRTVVERDRILVSDGTLNELADVLARAKFDAYVSIEERQGFLLRLARISELVPIVRRITVCRDPRDDKLLEVAVNGQADAIITGDNDLLSIARFEGTEIVSPSDFLERIETERGRI